MKIKVVSFDVEGTLTTHRFSDLIWEEAIPRLYSDKVGSSLEEAKSHVMREYEKFGEGRIEWYDIKYWFNHFGLAGYEKLLAHYKREISYYPDVEPVLEKLIKNYTLVISSNSSREFLELELERVKNYFHHIFSAPSDFKQTKNASDFYLKVCSNLEIASSEMAHVGDHLVFDFVIPRRVNVKAFYLDRKSERQNEFVVKDLKEFSDEVEKLET